MGQMYIKLIGGNIMTTDKISFVVDGDKLPDEAISIQFKCAGATYSCEPNEILAIYKDRETYKLSNQ